MISLDFEDIRISNEAFIKLKLFEYAISYLAIVQIGSSILQNELQQYSSENIYDFEYKLLLQLNIITAICNSKNHMLNPPSDTHYLQVLSSTQLGHYKGILYKNRHIDYNWKAKVHNAGNVHRPNESLLLPQGYHIRRKNQNWHRWGSRHLYY